MHVHFEFETRVVACSLATGYWNNLTPDWRPANMNHGAWLMVFVDAVVDCSTNSISTTTNIYYLYANSTTYANSATIISCAWKSSAAHNRLLSHQELCVAQFLLI